ncbi:MAG: type II toxin-antitoxin system RelE/ParE family toxin [Oscillospiraceae bacterium]|nr:type II toxin-antitoxin system RelE/ParE family toxin [Oscillospiraceae bacterium]MBQ6610729.1 type II toxin-antitoxin system RelE/ParE family toxin [Oscillospiraceae bacterium]
MNWEIHYSDEAKTDLRDLDGSQRKSVLKAIKKVSQNPLPVNEGGYGKPLGNKHGKDLTGLCKIKLMKEGIRVVYALIRTETTMKIVVIAARSDDEVYEVAAQRTK